MQKKREEARKKLEKIKLPADLNNYWKVYRCLTKLLEDFELNPNEDDGVPTMLKKNLEDFNALYEERSNAFEAEEAALRKDVDDAMRMM